MSDSYFSDAALAKQAEFDRKKAAGEPDDTRLYVNGEPRTPDAVYRHAVALIAAAQHAGDTQ